MYCNDTYRIGFTHHEVRIGFELTSNGVSLVFVTPILDKYGNWPDVPPQVQVAPRQ